MISKSPRGWNSRSKGWPRTKFLVACELNMKTGDFTNKTYGAPKQKWLSVVVGLYQVVFHGDKERIRYEKPGKQPVGLEMTEGELSTAVFQSGGTTDLGKSPFSDDVAELCVFLVLWLRQGSLMVWKRQESERPGSSKGCRLLFLVLGSNTIQYTR